MKSREEAKFREVVFNKLRELVPQLENAFYKSETATNYIENQITAYTNYSQCLDNLELPSGARQCSELLKKELQLAEDKLGMQNLILDDLYECINDDYLKGNFEEENIENCIKKFGKLNFNKK